MQKKFPNQQNRFMRLEVFSWEVENCPPFSAFRRSRRAGDPPAAKQRECTALVDASYGLFPLASPGGVAERSESFKIMIAGGNHSMIKKLSR